MGTAVMPSNASSAASPRDIPARAGSQAAEWFRLAAEQGYAKAQNKLAVIYYKGRGVDADGTEALKWAILAAQQGHREAKENRALLTKRLSAEQIAEAELLTEIFRPSEAPPAQ